MTSQELREKRQAELDAAQAIVDAADAESRPLTDEEDSQVKTHLETAKQAKADAEAAEKKEKERLQRIVELQNERADAAKPQPPIVRPSVSTAKPNVTGGEASGQFTHFGEYLFKVREAAVMPSITDRRLVPAASAPGMRSDVDSLGGFLIPVEYSSRILERMYTTGELLSRVKASGTYISLRGNTIKVPRVAESSRADGSRHGGVRGYWVGQTDSITDSKPAVGQMTLTLHKAGALGYITDEMLEDAPASGMFLERLLTNELLFTVENAIVNGNGSNKPLGLIAANCAVSASAETNQTADTIWGPNITKMWARMWAPSRANAVWLVNQSCEPYLFSLALEGRYGSASTAAEGIPLYYPAGSLLNQGQYAMLMGRPVLPVEYCQAVGTLGDIILWDPGEYILVDKAGGPQAASSIHVQFLTDQTTYRVTYRVDGQPTWDTSLTPYDAGDALSPIVLLTAR